MLAVGDSGDVSLAATVYAAVTVLGTAALLVAVQTADDGEPATVGELGPPRAVARALLTAALPPVAVLAAVAGGGVVFGDLAPATLGLAPRAFTPAAVVIGLGLGVGVWLLSVLQVWLLRRLGVSTDGPDALYPEQYRGLGWYAVGYTGQSAMEEGIFRAGLVGAVPVAVGVSPRLAVVVAAVAFGFAHADRGPGGVIVTGTGALAYGVGFLVVGLPAVIAGHTLQNTLNAAGKRLRNGRGSEDGNTGRETSRG